MRTRSAEDCVSVRAARAVTASVRLAIIEKGAGVKGRTDLSIHDG